MSEEQNLNVERKPAPVSSRNSLGIPFAIIFSAILIAGAIVFAGRDSGNQAQVANNQNAQFQTGEIEIAPITENDHIKGNPNAPILIIEYSDFDCPFCKNFHETMNQVMAEYGKDGKVAWVYRHFPLEQLHQNAPKIAAASECVASLGGNDAFWKFGEAVFSQRGTNEPTNINRLPEFAESAGVDKAKFDACVSAGTYDKAIGEDIAEAMKTGAKGTPYSILMVGDQKGVINGAQPLLTVRQMIQTVLAQIEGQ
jgi:protein-disulfide isomerase